MMWAIQKEIKDAYPKKVCHMPTRHEKKMHTQRRYATFPQGMSKKREEEEKKKIHTQRRYATCPQGMSKKKKKKKRDSPHPKEIKERDGS